MNILVNYTGRKGGGAIYSYEMTKGLIENGLDVYAIISSGVVNLEDWKKLRFKKLLIVHTYTNKFNFIIKSLKFYLYEYKKIENFFNKTTIDYIYVPMIQPWSYKINRIFKHSKKITTLHDPLPHSGESFSNRLLSEIVTFKSDKIIILSEKFYKYTKKKFKKKDKDVVVIPLGKFDHYSKYPHIPNLIEYDKSKINFLFFGRISKYKGLDILAKAYEKLCNDYNDVSLTVVGDGDFREYNEIYKNLKNTLVINRWIEDKEITSFFTGDNIVTVVPYIDATQSGVIPVAMEYKSLVIASNTGGISEQIINNYTGLLVKSNDYEELYKSMKTVKANFSQYKDIIENAFKSLEKYNWESLAKKIIIAIERE
jgi:glycosyltransferase involved in cell wall biosynthesis